MKMKKVFVFLSACLMFFGTKVSGDASLISRGDGLIYDTDLNVTWLADANYARTSGYDADGLMDRLSARAWADSLIYGGYDDWRLPATPQPDPTCSSQMDSVSFGSNCTGSEMGHLFYRELGGAAGSSIQASSDPDGSLFVNLFPEYYWSATTYAPGPNYSWDFGFGDGLQRAGNVSHAYAMAVRSGDVSVPSRAEVPEPGTWVLLVSALAGVAVLRTSGRWNYRGENLLS